MKFHKGDNVKIISGNDKGKTGKIIRVFPVLGKIVVEGVSIRKKHVRARRQGQKGEIVQIPASFPASRAMIFCSKCSAGVRIGSSSDDSGRRIRICKKCRNML